MNTTNLEKRASDTALLTQDGHFIYYRKNDVQGSGIVSLNLSDLSEVELLSYDDSQMETGSLMFELPNGHIILVGRVNGNNQLFKSIGGERFEAITAADLKTATSANTHINGFYFIERNDGAWVWTNGVSTHVQSFSEAVIPLCAFNTNQIIFATVDNNNWQLRLFDQEQLLPIFDAYFYHSDKVKPAHTTDACIINASDNSGNSQQLFYHQDGRAINTNRNDDVVLAMNDRFVAVKNQLSPILPDQIETLDSHNFTVIDNHKFPSSQFKRLELAFDRVYLFFANNSTQQQSVTILDQSLNPVSESILLSSEQQIVTTLELDIIVDNDTLIIYKNGVFQHKFPLVHQKKYTFYSNKLDSGFLYSNAVINETAANDNLYSLSDYPSVGPQLNGPWVDVNFENQGLSINPGQRTDGSHYIFLTYFLFRDGEPLWLAGSQNYMPGQTEITIDLFEFSGAGLLDTNTTPNRSIFGSINLKFNACDGLDGIMYFNNQTQMLDFKRVDDTSFNYRCVMP